MLNNGQGHILFHVPLKEMRDENWPKNLNSEWIADLIYSKIGDRNIQKQSLAANLVFVLLRTRLLKSKGIMCSSLKYFLMPMIFCCFQQIRILPVEICWSRCIAKKIAMLIINHLDGIHSIFKILCQRSLPNTLLVFCWMQSNI